MTLPYGKFFWSDYASDPALKICSFAAQGLWMRMLCIAAEHNPVGYVAVNSRGLDAQALARATGGSFDEVQQLLAELENNGVFSRDRKGTIYSRRMVRDAKKAKKSRENGKLGGNPTLCDHKENPSWDNPSVKGGDITHIPDTRYQNQNKREDKPLSARAIPDWLPSEEWKGFLAMRRKIKKPLTERATSMAIRKLSELRDNGEDPAAVLDQSTLHCWQDLYPVRPELKAQPTVPL